jgi:hypothetical protein
MPLSGSPALSVRSSGPDYHLAVNSEPAPRSSRLRRLASRVYDAHSGSRSPILDGPWWLSLTALVVVSVLVFGSNPWKWVVLPFAAALLWLPYVAHWVVALSRSVTAFREGFRS